MMEFGLIKMMYDLTRMVSNEQVSEHKDICLYLTSCAFCKNLKDVLEKLILSYNLITWQILIQMIPKIKSRCRNHSKFFFIFSFQV